MKELVLFIIFSLISKENAKDEKISNLQVLISELEEKVKNYERVETASISKEVFEQQVKEMEVVDFLL